MEGGLVLAVDEVDRDQVEVEHELLERVEVVVEVGEALAGGGREDQVAGAGEAIFGGSAASSSSLGPAERVERALEHVVRDVLDVRFDARQRGGDPPVAPSVSTGTVPAWVWKTSVPAPSRSASATPVAIVAWPQNGTSASGLK